MTGAQVAAFAAKFGFGLAAFLVIGYLGSSSDRRIAGTMLTFPVLNGIGLLTSPDKDPWQLTAGMMPVIALNGLLCLGFIATLQAVRRRAATAGDVLTCHGVALLSAVVWFMVVAVVLPRAAALLPASVTIAALYLAVTIVLTPWLWVAKPPIPPQPALARLTFLTFWRRRGWRFVFFVVSLFVLLIAAEISDAAWVGRLSALPLVPLCVLAGLAIDEPDSLPGLRDPILIGPGLAMLFVLPLTAVLHALHGSSGASYWGPAIAALMVGWLACVLAIRFGIPPLARALDWRKRRTTDRP
jgi:hypothetical protein